MPTVNDMLDRYEKERVPHLGERTRKDYRRHIRRLREHFGAKEVPAITRQEVRNFLAVPKGRVQRIRVISVLRAAFSAAISWSWVDGNPCTGMERSQPRKRDPALTLEEFQSAAKLAAKTRSGARLTLVMELVLHTGRQQGDILGLRWSHVDRQADTILFRNPHTKKGSSGFRVGKTVG
jgi:integrase